MNRNWYSKNFANTNRILLKLSIYHSLIIWSRRPESFDSRSFPNERCVDHNTEEWFVRDQSELPRYQLIQQMFQHFCQRSSKKYLQQLQQRNKWHKSIGTIRENDLIIIQEENLSPSTMAHGSNDAALLYDRRYSPWPKTISGIIKWPITKLCICLYMTTMDPSNDQGEVN